MAIDAKGYIPGLGQNVVVTSRDIDLQLGQFISVTLTSTQVLNMINAPVNIIPAPGANYAVVLTDAALDISAGTAYSIGGPVGLSYGGTSTFIAGTVGSAAFYGTTGTTVYLLTTNNYQIPSNTGVYLGNTTLAFITGTETCTVNAWYAVVPVSH